MWHPPSLVLLQPPALRLFAGVEKGLLVRRKALPGLSEWTSAKECVLMILTHPVCLSDDISELDAAGKDEVSTSAPTHAHRPNHRFTELDGGGRHFASAACCQVSTLPLALALTSTCTACQQLYQSSLLLLFPPSFLDNWGLSTACRFPYQTNIQSA